MRAPRGNGEGPTTVGRGPFLQCCYLIEILLVVIVLASISFRFFESPILRLKRRFETRAETAGDELRRAEVA